MDLAGTDIHLACPDVELPDGLAADTVRSRQLHNGVVGVESGGGVRGGDTVTGVTADGADVADLGTAHLVHGLSQNMEVFLDQGIPGNVGKAGEGADPQGPSASRVTPRSSSSP